MKNMTMIFTVVIVVIVTVYDVYAMAIGGTENSISHMLITYAYHYPILPFLVGFIMGHLFWRMRDTKETNKVSDKITK